MSAGLAGNKRMRKLATCLKGRPLPAAPDRFHIGTRPSVDRYPDVILNEVPNPDVYVRLHF